MISLETIYRDKEVFLINWEDKCSEQKVNSDHGPWLFCSSGQHLSELCYWASKIIIQVFLMCLLMSFFNCRYPFWRTLHQHLITWCSGTADNLFWYISLWCSVTLMFCNYRYFETFVCRPITKNRSSYFDLNVAFWR